MPIFSYKAKQGPGRVIDGVIEAPNIDQAVRRVVQLGFSPLDISEAQSVSGATVSKPHISGWPFNRRVTHKDMVLFTRQMADLIDAAIPILRCLEIVDKQTRHPQMKMIVRQICERVKDGAAFSDSLAKHPKIFSPLYVNMVRTGEVSGKLPLVMKRLAQYLENDQEIRARVRQSLAYPALICVVGFVMVFVLLSFVVPRLTVMFEDFERTLPTTTLFLIAVSSFLSRFWWIMIIMLILAVILFKRWIATETGQAKFDRAQLNVPLLCDFIKIVETGRLSRTLATLLESGVVMTTALSSAWATVTNSVLSAEMKQVSQEVNNGASLKSALSRSTFIPEMAIQMIAVGEETGHLEHGLYKVAETYERQSERTMKTMVALLGPLVLIVIVSIVGFVVISMILPILQMNTLIS